MRSLHTGTHNWCTLLSIFCAYVVWGAAEAAPQTGKAVSTHTTHSKTGAKTAMSASRTVQLSIENIRNTKGELRILVFYSSDGFPDDPGRAVFSATKPPTNNVTLEVPELQMGHSYAFSVLHDENGDGRLNTNFLGIPKEGIGFSRSPNLWLGKPKFEDCAEEIASSTQTILIKMHYF